MAVRPVGRFLGDHPAVLPVVVGLLLLAALAAPALGRRLGTGRVVAAALVLAVGVPLALTLLPAPGHAPETVGTCLPPRPVSEWGRGGEELANLLLLVPLGALLSGVLRGRRRAVAVAVAALAPLGVEAVQLALPALGRTCETTDVLLNCAGLALGASLGLVSRRGSGRRPTASPRT